MIFLKKYFAIYLLFAALFLVCQKTWAGSVEYCQVIETGGRAEVLEAGSVRWLSLIAPKNLKGGDKIRTLDSSYVEISTSSDFSGFLRLEPDSELEVMGDDLTRFFLHRGKLLVLREEDSNIPGSHGKEEFLFQVFTPQLCASLIRGGFSVNLVPKGAWVRVFSERVKVGPFGSEKEEKLIKTVSEGFKYFIGTLENPPARGPLRMRYNDYTDWQFWMRDCYERKDKHAEAMLVKNNGMGKK